jgi:hypothetical protein
MTDTPNCATCHGKKWDGFKVRCPKDGELKDPNDVCPEWEDGHEPKQRNRT